MITGWLIHINAPHFYAGVVLKQTTPEGEGVVHDAAPIVSYMRGWTFDQVEDYCREKGWHMRAKALLDTLTASRFEEPP